MPRSLYGRIALSFALIVVGLGAVLASLGYTAAKKHQHEIVQRLNLELAVHLAQRPGLLREAQASRAMFEALTQVNPNIEVYLLDADGRIIGASEGVRPARQRVDLGPVHALMAGAEVPLRGDNPLHPEQRDIFSAAPIIGDGRVLGYVYVLPLNDMYRNMVADAWSGYMLRSAGWLGLLAVALALIGGLAAFRTITRRLWRTVDAIERFALAPGADIPAPRSLQGDEIDRLSAAFGLLRTRLNAQMQELRRQDELRRELIANISHDIRTPLTSMQGYLETLARMDERLSAQERRRHLDVAVRQSHRVSHLAWQLFDLARLECQETRAQPEAFCIDELVQDIVQKFAIAAQKKSIALVAGVDAEQPLRVWADIGMIERAISNLVDNALRHTPEHGSVRVEACLGARGVEVRVADNGHGIPEDQLPGLLERGSSLRQMAVRRGGGLGLLIVKRILTLHDSSLHAVSRAGYGTAISFVLAMQDAPTARAA
jgi:signal transduction histidine kinase